MTTSAWVAVLLKNVIKTTMKHSKEERIIALAGLFQAATLVVQLARGETLDQEAVLSSIDSLFELNPDNTLAVYGGQLQNIRFGLKQLQQVLENQRQAEHGETARYVINLLAAEKQLRKQPDMLKTIGGRLQHLQYKREHFSDNLPDILQSLSGLYQDTLSTLPFRIKVNGERQHLTQAAVSDKIRALLFAGVRAAMLWRQLGGSKWQLLFGRSDIERISKQLLNQIPTTLH